MDSLIILNAALLSESKKEGFSKSSVEITLIFIAILPNVAPYIQTK
jgi:hypothetical protein